MRTDAVTETLPEGELPTERDTPALGLVATDLDTVDDMLGDPLMLTDTTGDALTTGDRVELDEMVVDVEKRAEPVAPPRAPTPPNRLADGDALKLVVRVVVVDADAQRLPDAD